MESPPADLEKRVFVAIAAGRGIVMLSRLHPELSPEDPELVHHAARLVLGYLQD